MIRPYLRDTMRTKSNNIETMMGNETNEFESLLQKYQEGLA